MNTEDKSREPPVLILGIRFYPGGAPSLTQSDQALCSFVRELHIDGQF